MKVFLALIACVWPLAAETPWYPLNPGNDWTYEHEMRSGNPRHPAIVRWTTVETIRGTVTIPEGTIVERDVRTEEGRPDNSWIARRSEFDYLVRRNCIYFLSQQDWAERASRLNPEFRGAVAARAISPDLCFPLQAGQSWAAAGSNEWAWMVAGRGCGNARFCPESVSPSDFHLVSMHAASGGQAHLWFRKYVGITGQFWFHAGTFEELRIRLVRFRDTPR